jgi:SIR2-like domain
MPPPVRPTISSVSPWPSGSLGRILNACDRPIPVIGAGMSVPSGFPTGPGLSTFLRSHSLAAGVDFSALPADELTNPLLVSQTICEANPDLRVPIHRAVRDRLLEIEANAAPANALRALAATPNAAALILTLNYDRLIERAADGIGRPVVTLGVGDIPALLADGLRTPDKTLRVLHLHGTLDDEPERLILDAKGYADRANDQNVRDLFTALLPYYTICILGSSFEELYLATVLQARRPDVPRHVIVCDAPVADRIYAFQAEIKPLVHNLFVCDYPDGDHAALDGFCARLVQCDEPAAGPEEEASIAVEAAAPDALYVSRRFAEQTPESVEDRRAPADENDVRAERRAVVVGVPGGGKTTLLTRLAERPEAGERGVLVRLRDVRKTIGTPGYLLREWVAVGSVLDGGGPVSVDGIEDGRTRVHLLLDGLDELPESERRAVAEAIVRVGEFLPEQRLTVSARPTADLEVFSGDWRVLELVCDDVWRDRLLERAGVTVAELQAHLGDAYAAVADLMKVPLYLRAALEAYDEKLEIDGAMALALQLLTRLIESDASLKPLGDAVTLWLTRVALTMSLNGTVVLDRKVLVELADATRLGDPSRTAELLASRALLREAAGGYSFQHRVLQEALVAQYLTKEDPAVWLDAVAPSSEGRSMVREEWAGVMALLLPVSEPWRTALAERDPRAAARAVPVTAEAAERRWAALTLWQRARELDIWLTDFDRSAPSDADILGRLLAAGGAEELADDIRRDLRDASRYGRGSAVSVLRTWDPPDAVALLRGVLDQDPDSTVRRNAASVAVSLELSELAGSVVRRGCAPEDDAEADDMAFAALRLVALEERLDVAARMRRAGNRRVADWEVVEGLNPAVALRWLAQRVRDREDDAADWWVKERLDQLIADLRRPRRATVVLVAYVAAAVEYNSTAVIDFVARYGANAAVGLLDAIGDGLAHPYEVGPLLRAVGTAALERQGAPAGIVALAMPFESKAPAPSVAPRAPRAAGGLEAILDIADPDERRGRLLRQSQALARQVRTASVEIKGRLAQELEALWNGNDLRAAVTLTPGGANLAHWAAGVLFFAPEVDLPLSSERWAQVALCGWLFEPQLRWLRQQQPDGAHRALLDQDVSPDALGDLAELAADDELEPLVAAIERAAPATFRDRHARRIVARLVRARRPDLLRRAAAAAPPVAAIADPELAAAGDVDAQRQQLATLASDLSAGARVDRHDYEWLANVEDPSLVSPLADAIREAGARRLPATSPFDDLSQPLQVALERIDPRAAVGLYDELISGPAWDGAQFLADRRDRALLAMLAGSGRVATAERMRALGLPELG